jgi:hypothetical protein
VVEATLLPQYQRPGQVEDAEQLRDGGDLVPPVGDRLLAQDQAVLRGPGADQVQAAAEGAARGADCLSLSLKR